MERKATTTRRRAAQATVATAAVWAPCADNIARYAVAATAAFLAARAVEFSLPKLPELKLPELPSLGGGGKKKEAAPASAAAPRPRSMNVKVRAATTGVAAPDAPTIGDLTGAKKDVSLGEGDGWQRFPARRMPGANMQVWKEAAKEMKVPDA